MNEAQQADVPKPLARMLMAFVFISGVALIAYFGIGLSLHFRQTRLQHRVTELSVGTPRDSVLRLLGTPTYQAADGSEWLYSHSRSALELPITPFYPTLYVHFSAAGAVTAAGISRD